MKSEAHVHPQQKVRRTALVVACFVAALLAWPLEASAHRVGISSGKYVSDGESAEATIAFRRDDLARAVPSLDADANGLLSDAELTPSEQGTADLLATFGAERGGTACAGKLAKLVADGGDGVSFTVRFEGCTGDASVLTIDVSRLLRGAGSGHRHAGVLEVPAELPKPAEVLLHGDNAKIELALTSPTGLDAAAPPAPPAAPTTHLSVAREFFVLGVEHIWTGIDHIVFLLGLVMLGGKMKDLLLTVSAFTVSHSITLALAVLGVVAPSPDIVEPIIALSVAYVGIENFVVKDTSKRWRIAAAFGFIHGFGFAGALGEVALPKESIPVALAMFNIGVEAGQLVLLLAIVPLFTYLRKQAWFTPRGMWAVSGAIVAAGLFWFVQRVAFAFA